MKKRVASILLALASISCFMFTSCGTGKTDSSLDDSLTNFSSSGLNLTEEEKAINTVEMFVRKYNDGDFEGMLACLEPKLANTTRALFNTLSGITGGQLGVDISFADLFTLGIGVQGAGDVLSVDIVKVELGEDRANVITQATFSGDTETTYFYMVKEGDSWLIGNITETKPSIVPVAGMTVTPGGPFVGGICMVRYTLDGQEYGGFMNTNGQIVYKFVLGTEYIMNWGNYMGDGSVIMEESSGAKKIINNRGKVVATFEKNTFDTVCSVGDEHALVYKEENNINGISHYYGIINSKGDWVMPMCKKDSANWGGIFLGSDFMISCEGTKYRGYDYVIYNLNTKQELTLHAETGMRDLTYGISNGCLYILNEEFKYVEGGEKVNTNFKINPDCTIANLEMNASDITITGDYFVYQDEDKGCTIFENIATGNKIEYNDYAEMQKTVTNVGDYFLLRIEGLNGKKYATLLDLSGIQQFEPVELKDYDGSVTYANGLFMYSEQGMCIDTVLDAKGNVVLNNVELRSIFYNGVAIAKDLETGDLIFINQEGERAFENFYINE